MNEFDEYARFTLTNMKAPEDIIDCIIEVYKHILEYTEYTDRFDVIKDSPSFEEYCDILESHQLSRNKLIRYFYVKLPNYEVKLPKSSREILLTCINGTEYNEMFD